MADLNLNTFIPKFRVHVAISQVNDEILVSPMSKWALSPYPDIDAGYAWSDFEPVSVIPFASPAEILGKLIVAAIEISQIHYRAQEAKNLLKNREERRKYLVKRFGKENPRFYHPPSFSYVASIAPDYDYFLEKYMHLLVEDDSESYLRFIVDSAVGKSDLHPVQNKFPSTSSTKVLGQTIQNLYKSR